VRKRALGGRHATSPGAREHSIAPPLACRGGEVVFPRAATKIKPTFALLVNLFIPRSQPYLNCRFASEAPIGTSLSNPSIGLLRHSRIDCSRNFV